MGFLSLSGPQTITTPSFFGSLYTQQNTTSLAFHHKTPAYVFGERVVRPAIDSIGRLLGYLNARVSQLFVFPGASAMSVKLTDNRVAVIHDSALKVKRGAAYTAYVTYTSVDGVSVIDTQNNKLIATLRVGVSPEAVAITPDGKYVYVANTGYGTNSDTTSVIDTATNKIIATVAVGNMPSGVAITPNGRYAYIPCEGPDVVNGYVGVIDTTLNAVVATISVGLFPANIAITPNGLYAYVSNTGYGANSVSVIDISTNKVIDTIGFGDPRDNQAPSGIVASLDSKYVYVASMNKEGNSYVCVIDTSSNKVVESITVDMYPTGVAINPNGQYVYVTHSGVLTQFPKVYSNTVSVIATASNTVIAVVKVGNLPQAVAITPDGLYAYVINFQDASLSIIATNNNTVITTVPYPIVGVNPTAIAITTTHSNREL